MARYLLESGYQPIVVTGGGATLDRWAPEDQTLIAEIPEDLEVWRVPAADEPPGSSRWRGRAERWLQIDSAWARWWIDGSVKIAREVGSDVDLVYVWMQPYDSARAGSQISAGLKTPWVADLGDPWALDEMMVYPSGFHRRRELRRMRRLLGTASAVVMSTPEAVRRLVSAFPELSSKPVVAIPNGFDATDFEDASPPTGRGDRFRIVHTGYLHTELGQQYRRTQRLRRALGGSVPGLDILTRSHVFLIEAINRLLAEDPALADELELHLAGVLTDADRTVAESCPIARLHGYVTHGESIALMRSASLLFLPMQNLPEGTRATIVPGKTYEYLASGTPILAAAPDGDARDILEEAGNAILVRPEDVDAIAAGILEARDRWRKGASPRPDPNVVRRFEYRTLARDLAAVFDEALAGGRSTSQLRRA
jgi:glycosyltransferase involved in cell wall biosynthesis